MEVKERKNIGTSVRSKEMDMLKRRTGRKTDPVFDTVSVQQYFAAAV